MKHFVQWLYPGLSIKRWMLLFSVGIIILVFGATLIMNYQIFGVMEEHMLRLAYQITGSYSYTFLAICGRHLDHASGCEEAGEAFPRADCS